MSQLTWEQVERPPFFLRALCHSTRRIETGLNPGSAALPLRAGKAGARPGSGLNTVRLDAKSVRAELVEALSSCDQTLRQAQGERLNEQYWRSRGQEVKEVKGSDTVLKVNSNREPGCEGV